jgi:hypothetical protein
MTLINREDAIDELRRLIPYKKYHKGEWVHLLDKREVFKALNALPSVSATKKLNNQIHLCDSCKYDYPNCPSENEDVLFGNDVGNDNICCCAKYLASADRPHGRLIDADKLKKQLDTVYNEMANERERKGLRLARWFLISAPTVSADRPTGEWIEYEPAKVYWNGEEVYAYMNNYTCSVCEGEAHIKYDYCPNCGARMI